MKKYKMSRIHSMKLQRKYFDAISNGSKIYEGRINDNKRKSIEVGDSIVFTCENMMLNKTITQKLEFSSFEEAFENISLELCLPGITNVDQAIDLYYSFGFEEEEKIYGVVFFKF